MTGNRRANPPDGRARYRQLERLRQAVDLAIESVYGCPNPEARIQPVLIDLLAHEPLTFVGIPLRGRNHLLPDQRLKVAQSNLELALTIFNRELGRAQAIREARVADG